MHFSSLRVLIYALTVTAIDGFSSPSLITVVRRRACRHHPSTDSIVTRWQQMKNKKRMVNSQTFLRQSSQNQNSENKSNVRLSGDMPTADSILAIAALAIVSFFYWYWLVLGAAAQKAGLPLIPDWLPMTPGWPPSDADLAPVVEDSVNFFYLSNILQQSPPADDINAVSSQPPALRLGLFNIAEAWIFAFLPLLWADRNRLPRPILSVIWLGALGLTNAFLAPYLLCCEIFKSKKAPEESSALPESENKNRVASAGMAIIASLVVGYAVFQIISSTNEQDIADFATLVREDRTYMAFCVDLVLFSIFQSLVLGRVKEDKGEQLAMIDTVPFIGLIKWSLE